MAAVAVPDSSQPSTGPTLDPPHVATSIERLAGTWVSELRESQWGPMHFEFRIGSEAQFEVIGIPASSATSEVYRRSGPVRLEGDQLISPAINEGQPIQMHLDGDELVLVVDE